MGKVRSLRPGGLSILLLLSLLILTSCSTLLSSTSPEKGAQELSEEGMAYLREGTYHRAAECFQHIKDRYPFSQYGLLADLKLADIHYYIEQYDEAISEYREFEKLHPTNEALPYIVYQIAMSYYEQIPSVDRDPTYATDARNEFQRLINTYADSPYTVEAREKIRQCRQHLAEYELYVGRFYFRTEQYQAALKRLKRLVDEYPDASTKDEAIALIKECQGKTAS